MTLPRSLDELAGLRAARWTRESTAGQYDAFGPDAQREQQDRALERWGLVDSGTSWTVAHSGWRRLDRHPAWAEMLAGAGRGFDVLVVGYASRFARSLEAHVDARRAFHAAGAALLFADEGILSSDESAWEHWAREVVESEAYSRRLARRIREGYAAKRRRLGEPGGRPPYGFRRGGRPPALERIDDLAARAARVFALAAAGETDRTVAAHVDLPIDTVRGILTNPIYVGHLRDGSPASVKPVVDVATWQRVQELRAARATRGGKPETFRTYALPMLRCAACGARLIGDTGRYRHRRPCAAFTAARRRLAFRNRLVRSLGTSYPQAFYEDAIGSALGEWALGSKQLTEASAIDTTTSPDQLALSRVTAERSRALTRYSRDRDVAALEATMARLDRDERAAREPVAAVAAPWPEVLPWLQDLAGLWRESEPAMRRRMAEQLFVHVDALGCREIVLTPTAAAIGLAGAQTVTLVGARGFGSTTVRVRTPAPLHVVEGRTA